MRGVHRRFIRWFDWSGQSQKAVGKRLRKSQAYVSYLLSGDRSAGLVVAHLIEVVTAAPHPKTGDAWPDGPIRVAEWCDATGSAPDPETAAEAS